MSQEISKTLQLNHADILAFAEKSGDMNPIHLSAVAEGSFDQPVAHGMWLFSQLADMLRHDTDEIEIAAFDLMFPAPARVGETLTFRVTPRSSTCFDIESVIEATGEPCLTGTVTLSPPDPL
ncbi:MAG: MaoC family dehydratase [Parvularcula sp.]